MRKLVLHVSFLCFIVLILCGFKFPHAQKVCIRGACITAEVAATDTKRQKGLMFRRGLAADKGMLFIFEKEGKYSFWMKNVRFSLDIIWVSADKKIVDIHENVSPCKEVCANLTPRGPARFVLEVKAGFAKAKGLEIGDSVEF
jgi:uncharacterized protein